MTFDVTLADTFHGPMDLLLYLVRRDEIDIHDIPIAHLTGEYLRELDRMREMNIDLAADFVSMAAMLVEIKSRMLLPAAEPLEGEEEDADIDPRAGLVQALLEYKRFKEAAASLGQLQEAHAQRFQRYAPLPDAEEGTIAMDELGVVDLFAAFNKMVHTLLTTEAQEIVSDEVPTEVRLEQIRTALQAAGRVRFSLLLSSEPTKGEMVGFFIALMELIRLREVRARQSEDFGDIHIEPRRADAADAGATLADVVPACGPRRAVPGFFAPLTSRRQARRIPRRSRGATAPLFPVLPSRRPAGRRRAALAPLFVPPARPRRG